eukprot:scaffold101519_cov60-Phaeocystis_antarctica.AAC.1
MPQRSSAPRQVCYSRVRALHRTGGDHDLFMGAREGGARESEQVRNRKRVQMLRAKVEQEREARRLAEKQLKAMLERVGVSPRNKKRMWNKNDHGGL